MPKLMLMAGAGALALSAALYALAGGTEGKTLLLPVLTQKPVQPSCVTGTAPSSSNITIISEKNGVTCYRFNAPDFYRGAYINVKDVLEAVTSQGGTVKALEKNRFEIRLSGAGGTISPLFTANGQAYVSASTLVGGVFIQLGDAASLNKVTLQGYGQPLLKIGKMTLQLGDGSSEIGPYFYASLIPNLVGYLVDTTEPGQTFSYTVTMYSATSPGEYSHRVQTQLKKDEMVMLLTATDDKNYTADIAPVTASGEAIFKSNRQNLHFVADPTQLALASVNGRAPALLVRITNVAFNTLKSGIFIPKQNASNADP